MDLSFLSSFHQFWVHANSKHLLKGANPAAPNPSTDATHLVTLFQDECCPEGLEPFVNKLARI